MTFTIRPYHPDDACACRALWADLVQVHRTIYEDDTIGGPDPGSHFDSYRQDPSLAGIWVADQRSKVIGMTGLLLKDGNEGELEPLIVARYYRRGHVGRQLVEKVLAEAKTRGLRHLCVQPVARNVDAIRFFVRSGFRIAGRLELFMDLQAYPRKIWKPGLTIHGEDVEY